MKGLIWPGPLIVQANALVDADGDGSAVTMIDLRRAVSNAYYALFHTTSICTAEWLIPDAAHEERYALVRRFSHKSFRSVYERVAQPASNKVGHLQLVFDTLNANADLVVLAEAYVDLCDARTTADYDHLASLTRTEVLTLIQRSALAIKTIRKAPNKHPVDSYRLFGCLALTPGAPGR